MKTLALIPFLMGTPLNVNNTTQITQEIQYTNNVQITQYDNYYTTIRKETLQTKEGNVKLWQLEKYQQDDNTGSYFYNVRQTFTIAEIDSSLNAIEVSRTINYDGNNDVNNNAITQVTSIAYIPNNSLVLLEILQAENSYIYANQKQIAEDLEYLIVNNRSYYKEQQWTTTYQDSYQEDLTQNSQKYYILIEQHITSQNNVNLTDSQQLKQGYNNVKINDIWTININTDNYEVVDIAGLMWQILSMPFSFISTAFNFTFFENTPYAISVANTLFTIIGGLIIIYVVRKFTK